MREAQVGPTMVWKSHHSQVIRYQIHTHRKTNGVDSEPMGLNDWGEGLEMYLRGLES